MILLLLLYSLLVLQTFCQCIRHVLLPFLLAQNSNSAQTTTTEVTLQSVQLSLSLSSELC